MMRNVKRRERLKLGEARKKDRFYRGKKLFDLKL